MSRKILAPAQENEMLEKFYQNHWAKLIRGVRVVDGTVVITVKGGNLAASYLCGELIKEMEMRDDV